MAAAQAKRGLALSGGGFRASLFHIGVLARLAELRLLQDIQVLSTVSGGSIIGAYYYLKLKQLLEGKRPDFPKAASSEMLAPYFDHVYIRLVQEIETEFLAAVQKNLRMRALCNPVKTARMWLSDDYSRSDRMAELYDEHLYLPLWKQMGGKDPALGMRVWNAVIGRSNEAGIDMREIAITPVEALLPAGMSAADFNVRDYNAAATCPYKIPVLTINATTLNTGHPWHFTGSWIGEPEPNGNPSAKIDTNRVLEQLRFDGKDRQNAGLPRAPAHDSGKEKNRAEKLSCIKLADAVAASAGVPGLFHPLAIHDLYWNSKGEEIVVELVDGGVYDNQGLDALFDAQCTDIICSDASGQLEDDRAPATGATSVFMRANDILMDRVRSAGYDDLARRGNFAFIHLREQFPDSRYYPQIPGPVDRATDESGHVYRLSNLRTDLDSFSDLEAYTLMYDGYCLAQKALGAGQPLPQPATAPWRFVAIRHHLRDADESRRLLKHLDVGRSLAFKVFRLGSPMAWLLLFLLPALFVWTLQAFAPGMLEDAWAWLNKPFTAWEIVTGAAGMIAITVVRRMALPRFLERVLDAVRLFRCGLGGNLLGLAAAGVFVALSIPVVLHLLIFDKLFLRSGRGWAPSPPTSSTDVKPAAL